MSNYTNISKGYLIKDPISRTVGDITFVTATVVDNPVGDKNKARYVPLFIELTFTGKRGELVSTLKKGNMLATRGWVGIRMYEDKEGKTRIQGEMPYPEGLTLFGDGERAADAPSVTAPPKPVVLPGKVVPAIDPFA